LRVLAEETPEGPLLGNTTLLPRDWTRVLSHRRSIWERASREYGVFVTDEVLGWTVGRNRKGVGPFGETYFSNEDGLRAPKNGASLRERSSVLRIALLGDSYTFGEDVSYEDTWGHQLETRLGTDVQVLNFGVPAYGVDQAYLRYLRDVRDWKPDIVILSFISHDVVRSGMVYYWIGFAGAAVPGAKPRFSLAGKQLAPLNLPLPSMEQIHSVSTIGDLPFIELDSAYNSADWEWHLYQYSYLFRFLISWRGNPLSTSYEFDADIQQVSEAIFKSFIRTVQTDGALPMVVFLPEYTEFRHSFKPLSERDLLGRRVAREAGIEFLDLTSCLESVGDGDRFTTGWHYTPQANGVVARCLDQQITGAGVVGQEQKSVTQ
ncbi:MAG: SGNH/GDSL hydrolase family protein, partial [Nitrospirales bacterium]|nr:SGNH/GDSL hydrolase family protein [Nitrospirales bacterium]